MEHMVSIEFMSQGEIDKVKRFSYFSGFRNYTSEFKRTKKVDKVIRKLFTYFSERFNKLDAFLDEEQNISTLILHHKESASYFTKKVGAYLRSPEKQKFAQQYNIVIYDEDSMKEVPNCEGLVYTPYFAQLDRVFSLKITNYDDLSSDKVFIILDRMKRVPTSAHLGVIYSFLLILTDEDWINCETQEFCIEQLFQFLESHLLGVYKIFKGIIRKTKSCLIFKIEPKNLLKKEIKFKKGTQGKNIPRLSSKSVIFRYLERASMVQKAIENADEEYKGHGFFKVKNYLNMNCKIFVLTWNLADYSPKISDQFECEKLMQTLLDKMEDPDIIIINFQEIVELKAHNVIAIVGVVQQNSVPKYKTWKSFFQKYFLNVYSDYMCLNHKNLLALGIFHFAKKSLREKIEVLNSEYLAFTSLANPLIANKGAILASYRIYDSTVLFVNCHLPSGDKREEEIDKRAEKVEAIMKHIKHHKSENIREYDLMVFSGDMNLRVWDEQFPWECLEIEKIREMEDRDVDMMSPLKSMSNLSAMELVKRESVLEHRKDLRDPKKLFSLDKGERLTSMHYKLVDYLKGDEVIKCQRHKILNKHFIEGRLPLFPTYKYIKKNNRAVLKGNRAPSWTDRIFYHRKTKLVRLSNLDAKSFHMEVSDHMY
jgi:hypothetical protein